MKKKVKHKVSTIEYDITGLKNHDRPGNVIKKVLRRQDIKVRTYPDRSAPAGRMSFDDTSAKRTINARNSADQRYNK